MEKLKRHGNADLLDSQNPVPPPKMANANVIESSALDTSILDLNDDCLREVFEHFSLDDLCAVADVCSRFKGIAQESYKPSKHKLPEFQPDFPHEEQQLRHMAKVLRNFGAYMEEIKSYGDWSQECRNRFLELVSRYCGEKLIVLDLHHMNEAFTEEDMHSVRPALRYLEKFYLECWAIEQLFLEGLPIWSPNLRELRLYADQCEDQDGLGLHQNYPKLERVTFGSLKIDDIKEFLKLNPQLKEYDQLFGFKAPLIPFFASYTPNIEKLGIEMSSWQELDRNHIKCLSQLSALKSLRVGGGRPILHFPLSEIDFASIPLEDLHLRGLDISGEAIGITKLKKLKSLTLISTKGFTISHIIDICKQCTELSRLHLNTTLFDVGLTGDNLLEIIQHAQNLHSLEHREQPSYRAFDDVYHDITMDAEIYRKIGNMVQNRAHKLTLIIGIINSPRNRYRGPRIPRELGELYKETFECKFDILKKR